MDNGGVDEVMVLGVTGALSEDVFSSENLTLVPQMSFVKLFISSGTCDDYPHKSTS